MIGYPKGVWDAKNNPPVIRKGITATHANAPLPIIQIPNNIRGAINSKKILDLGKEVQSVVGVNA